MVLCYLLEHLFSLCPFALLNADIKNVVLQKSVRKGREENELIGSVTLPGGGVAVGDEAEASDSIF